MAETMANKTTPRQIAVEVEKTKERQVEIISQMLEVINSIDTANAD